MMAHSIRATIFCGVLALAGSSALAHGGGETTEQTARSAWHFTPDIVISTALVVSVYAAGMVRRRTSRMSPPWWRQTMFFAGVAAVFLALQSPVDAIAERLFFVHQIQHLLLRMLGPMLLALSWPEGILIAGLPLAVKRMILTPVISNGAVRCVFGFIARPAVATILFVAALYFWEIPRYHDLALLNEPLHYLMHATMLLAGLVFWWRVFDWRTPKSAVDFDDGEERWWRPFDERPSSHGLRYGVRLMMLWVVILSNILLGAYTTLKTTVLYSAYDVLGRLYGYSARGDEQIGGIVIWIPSSMMCLVAVLIVIHLWGLHESRMNERRPAQSTSNSAALIERARPKNRAMAAGFGVFVFVIFATAILIGVLYDRLANLGT